MEEPETLGARHVAARLGATGHRDDADAGRVSREPETLTPADLPRRFRYLDRHYVLRDLGGTLAVFREDTAGTR